MDGIARLDVPPGRIDEHPNRIAALRGQGEQLRGN